MTEERFLPLGTVCIIKGNTKKLMVIARGLATVVNQETVYFDYGACLYPEGLLGDSLIYFNNEDVQKIVQEGYVNEEEELVIENLTTALKQAELPKGKTSELKKALNQR